SPAGVCARLGAIISSAKTGIAARREIGMNAPYFGQSYNNCDSLMDRRRHLDQAGGCMRFTWFNLMPWPYLPDDFREKNRSVWVDIDPKLFDPAKGHEVYNNHLDLLEYASTLGF